MAYETKGGLPSQGETLAKMTENIRQLQESAYMMSHLVRAQGGQKENALADGWFSIGELMKRLNYQVVELAKGRLQ